MIARGIREIAIKPINVMLNLFQHLIKAIGYETLKRVQGDKEVDFSNASAREHIDFPSGCMVSNYT